MIVTHGIQPYPTDAPQCHTTNYGIGMQQFDADAILIYILALFRITSSYNWQFTIFNVTQSISVTQISFAVNFA